MKNLSKNHSVTDDGVLIAEVENQIFVKGEKVRVGNKIFQIEEIISPVIRLRVKEIENNG